MSQLFVKCPMLWHDERRKLGNDVSKLKMTYMLLVSNNKDQKRHEHRNKRSTNGGQINITLDT